MLSKSRTLWLLMSVFLVTSIFSTGFFSQIQRQPSVKAPGLRLMSLEDSYKESQKSGSEESCVRSAVDAYFEAKYRSLVLEDAVDIAFVVDQSSTEGLDLYNYELGLIKYRLAWYAVTGTPHSEYEYQPEYGKVTIEDGAAQIVMRPCADITYADVDDSDRVGTEEHQLQLIRTDEGWKIRSDAYKTEMTAEHPEGTDFDALIASLPERYAAWIEAEESKALSLPTYPMRGEPGHYEILDAAGAAEYAHDYADYPYNVENFVFHYDNDCANFFSQCMWAGFGGENAGIDDHELPMIDNTSGATDWWGDSSHTAQAWAYVPDFLDMIQENNDSDLIGPQGYEISLSQVIQGCAIVWDDPEEPGPDDHIYIACHVTDLDSDGVTDFNEIWVCAHTRDRNHDRLSDFHGGSGLTFYRIVCLRID